MVLNKNTIKIHKKRVNFNFVKIMVIFFCTFIMVIQAQNELKQCYGVNGSLDGLFGNPNIYRGNYTDSFCPNYPNTGGCVFFFWIKNDSGNIQYV